MAYIYVEELLAACLGSFSEAVDRNRLFRRPHIVLGDLLVVDTQVVLTSANVLADIVAKRCRPAKKNMSRVKHTRLVPYSELHVSCLRRP